MMAWYLPKHSFSREEEAGNLQSQLGTAPVTALGVPLDSIICFQTAPVRQGTILPLLLGKRQLGPKWLLRWLRYYRRKQNRKERKRPGDQTKNYNENVREIRDCRGVLTSKWKWTQQGHWNPHNRMWNFQSVRSVIRDIKEVLHDDAEWTAKWFQTGHKIWPKPQPILPATSLRTDSSPFSPRSNYIWHGTKYPISNATYHFEGWSVPFFNKMTVLKDGKHQAKVYRLW